MTKPLSAPDVYLLVRLGSWTIEQFQQWLDHRNSQCIEDYRRYISTNLQDLRELYDEGDELV